MKIKKWLYDFFGNGGNEDVTIGDIFMRMLPYAIAMGILYLYIVGAPIVLSCGVSDSCFDRNVIKALGSFVFLIISIIAVVILALALCERISKIKVIKHVDEEKKEQKIENEKREEKFI